MDAPKQGYILGDVCLSNLAIISWAATSGPGHVVRRHHQQKLCNYVFDHDCSGDQFLPVSF